MDVVVQSRARGGNLWYDMFCCFVGDMWMDGGGCRAPLGCVLISDSEVNLCGWLSFCMCLVDDR
jgi:hypothetical protein